MSQGHDVVDTPEGKQPRVRAGPFPLYTAQNIGRWQAGGMFWNDCQIALPPGYDSEISLLPAVLFSNFSYRLGLLRYFLINFFFFFYTHTHEVFPQRRVYALSFSIRNRNPNMWKDWIWGLFLTNPKTIFRCARKKLFVNIHYFEEISAVLIWLKIA